MATDIPREKHRQYANWLQVGFSRDEFVIDFGQSFDAEKPDVHTGIVTSPRLLGVMLRTLQESLVEHRRTFPTGQVQDQVS